MPTKFSRVNITLKPELFSAIANIARREDVSLSNAIRELVEESLEVREDVYWQKCADARKTTFNKKTSLKHSEVWK